MKVLWHWKNWLRIEVALDHEFQITFGFVYSYSGETYPWMFTIHFICFRIVLTGSVEKAMARALEYSRERDASLYEEETGVNDEWHH